MRGGAHVQADARACVSRRPGRAPARHAHPLARGLARMRACTRKYTHKRAREHANTRTNARANTHARAHASTRTLNSEAMEVVTPPHAAERSCQPLRSYMGLGYIQLSPVTLILPHMKSWPCGARTRRAAPTCVCGCLCAQAQARVCSRRKLSRESPACQHARVSPRTHARTYTHAQAHTRKRTRASAPPHAHSRMRRRARLAPARRTRATWWRPRR